MCNKKHFIKLGSKNNDENNYNNNDNYDETLIVPQTSYLPNGFFFFHIKFFFKGGISISG